MLFCRFLDGQKIKSKQWVCEGYIYIYIHSQFISVPVNGLHHFGVVFYVRIDEGRGGQGEEEVVVDRGGHFANAVVSDDVHDGSEIVVKVLNASGHVGDGPLQPVQPPSHVLLQLENLLLDGREVLVDGLSLLRCFWPGNPLLLENNVGAVFRSAAGSCWWRRRSCKCCWRRRGSVWRRRRRWTCRRRWFLDTRRVCSSGVGSDELHPLCLHVRPRGRHRLGLSRCEPLLGSWREEKTKQERIVKRVC